GRPGGRAGTVRAAAVRPRRPRLVRRDGRGVDGRRVSAGSGTSDRAAGRRARAGAPARLVRGSRGGGRSPGVGGYAVAGVPRLVAYLNQASAPTGVRRPTTGRQ